MPKINFDPTINWNIMIYLAGLIVAGSITYAQVQATVGSLSEAIGRNSETIARQEARTLALEIANATDRSTLAAVQRDIALIRDTQTQTNSLLRELLTSGGK